jgi:hypothetical protein
MTRVMHRAVRGVAALGAFALATVVCPADARAQSSSVDCTIYEIKASSKGKGIDAELKPLEKKLSKGPFKAWTRFEKLAVHKKKLVRMKPVEAKLVPGKLSVLYKGTIREKGRKDRVRLSLTVDDKQGKRVIDTGTEQDSGDYFLIVDGRLRIRGGDYILALSCLSE